MTQSKEVKKVGENTFNSILNRISELENQGLRLPENYSAENALRSAWLILQETQTKDKRPVLEACSKESIANSVLKMVVQGLNPIKKQCYFVAYGKKLECMPSYQGQIATAKRHGLKDVKPVVIRQGDEFNYTINQTGKYIVENHDQPFGNLNNPIVGAYAVVTYQDGSIDTEIMTIDDIKKAWAQGSTNGNSPAHKNFDGEMCKKTVVNRALKGIINSSDDAGLMDDKPAGTPTDAYVDEQIQENANKIEVDFERPESLDEHDDADDVQQEQEEPQKKEDTDKEKKRPESMPDGFGQEKMSGPGF